MVGISGILIFSNLRNAQRPRKTTKYILTNLHTILKTHIGIKKCRIKFSFISAIHPRNDPKLQKLLKLGLKMVQEPDFFSFFRFCVGGSLRGWMTNSGNERDLYSALFDTYVGFQNGV